MTADCGTPVAPHIPGGSKSRHLMMDSRRLQFQNRRERNFMKKYQKPTLRSLGLLRLVTKFSDIGGYHHYWF